MYEGYLPISKQDMQERGIKQLDFVYVCGDAPPAEAGNSDVGRKLSAQTDDACTIRLQHRKLLCEHQFLFLSGTCLSGNFNKRGLYIIQA